MPFAGGGPAVISAAMTDLYETQDGRKAPGPGHNLEGEVVWERWQKKRTFVRALEGTYGDLTNALLEAPRVYSSRNIAWKGGPQHYGKKVINPQATAVTQSIETHVEAYAPSAYGQKHGHLNSAVFFVLKGRGHDIHDGRHIPWQAGDVMIVDNILALHGRQPYAGDRRVIVAMT